MMNARDRHHENIPGQLGHGLELDVVNAALYLRWPLIVTGRPGRRTSSLAFRIARELQLGRVVYGHVTSHTYLNRRLYVYDAIGRAAAEVWHSARHTWSAQPLPEPMDDARGDGGRLGPLGTAFLPGRLVRVLPIDELDKTEADLPNDLLDIVEEGDFPISDLVRVRRGTPEVRVWTDDLNWRATIVSGRCRCRAFPVAVITSNGERDFAPLFLRRRLRRVVWCSAAAGTGAAGVTAAWSRQAGPSVSCPHATYRQGVGSAHPEWTHDRQHRRAADDPQRWLAQFRGRHALDRLWLSRSRHHGGAGPCIAGHTRRRRVRTACEATRSGDEIVAMVSPLARYLVALLAAAQVNVPVGGLTRTALVLDSNATGRTHALGGDLASRHRPATAAAWHKICFTIDPEVRKELLDAVARSQERPCLVRAGATQRGEHVLLHLCRELNGRPALHFGFTKCAAAGRPKHNGDALHCPSTKGNEHHAE